MRLRPRPLRPQTQLSLVVLMFILAVLLWAGQELARTRKRQVLVGLVSGLVFLSFWLGWSVQEVK